MARGGFLGRGIARFGERIARAVGNIFTPSPPPERPRPPSPPPEPLDSYRKIWRDEGGRGSYRQNLDVFHRLVDEVEPDEAERRELWESFVRNINRNRRGDAYRRQDTLNPFWQDSGIAPDAMDWKRWRIAMGYTGKNRSRTS